MKVVAIYDNGGKTLDRYTVLTDEIVSHPSGEPMRDQFMYLGMSENGTGFSQWGDLVVNDRGIITDWDFTK